MPVKMLSSNRILLLVTSLAYVHCATHIVKVAESGLDFTPNSLTAAIGDQVEFHFVHGGHTVTQGDFTNPCQPSSPTAFYSGVVSTSNGLPFTVTINNTNPIYFYCSMPSHCQFGMAGAINAPDNQSASAYISAASNTDNSGSPKGVQGGVFAPASSSATASPTHPLQSTTVSKASFSGPKTESALSSSKKTGATSSTEHVSGAIHPTASSSDRLASPTLTLISRSSKLIVSASTKLTATTNKPSGLSSHKIPLPSSGAVGGPGTRTTARATISTNSSRTTAKTVLSIKHALSSSSKEGNPRSSASTARSNASHAPSSSRSITTTVPKKAISA